MEKNPTEDEVVQIVLDIKKSEPELGIAKLHNRIKGCEPTWALSVNRLKSIIRSHSLTDTSKATSNDNGATVPEEFRDRLYVSQTVSHVVSDLSLPPSIEVFNSQQRGKGLEVSGKLPKTESIPEGTVLWTEPALVLIPPISLVGLIPTGKACSYCARPLVSMSSLIASCSICSGRWCSTRCRKLDKLHKYIRHGKYTSEWSAIEQFAVENEWSAFYQYAYTLAAATFDDQDGDQSSKHIKEGVEGLAKIRQDIRQKADPQHDKNIFLGEHLEILWQEGYKVLCKFFAHMSTPSYEEYLSGIGMVNINNLDGSIYLLQSHLNHSCEPSVDVKIVGRTAGVKVTAKRNLHPEEELTTTYVDLKKDVTFRRQKLLEGWGFWCTCPRCMREQDLTLADDSGILSSKDNVASNLTADAVDSSKKKKKVKSKSKQKISEPPRVRKKSVTFDDNVVQIEI
ncbi:hypothetical protein V1525DRAFT_394940 [Lipomyces kononenkoae]|uniref:Uncharacterized protein n=1 Tax=Lipomyces kononenkoae TaxID=34357 RepID=A0ACC3TC06_LIPKO